MKNRLILTALVVGFHLQPNDPFCLEEPEFNFDVEFERLLDATAQIMALKDARALEIYESLEEDDKAKVPNVRQRMNDLCEKIRSAGWRFCHNVSRLDDAVEEYMQRHLLKVNTEKSLGDASQELGWQLTGLLLEHCSKRIVSPQGFYNHVQQEEPNSWKITGTYKIFLCLQNTRLPSASRWKQGLRRVCYNSSLVKLESILPYLHIISQLVFRRYISSIMYPGDVDTYNVTISRAHRQFLNSIACVFCIPKILSWRENFLQGYVTRNSEGYFFPAQPIV